VTAATMPMVAALTDLGNAERFIRDHGDHVRYVAPWRSWLEWDGHRWRRDETCAIERRAKETVRTIWGESGKGGDKETRAAIAKWAEKSEAIGRVRAMVEMARAEPGIALTPASFDQHPFLFVAANGTLDLTTAQLRAHRPTDLLTKMSPVAFDPEAPCPTWEAFLEKVFDGNRELISYLQRAIGYSLTGDTREQCLHVMHGAGQNGKSTFLDVLAHVLGDYAVQADFATFLDRQMGDGPRNDIARLNGARLVRSVEVGEGKRFNEPLIKVLTGDDIVAARFLYSEAFEFRPTFKLWLAANHKPVIRGADLGIWRRVRLVPFTVTISEAEKDDTLKGRLMAEAPGILAWAVAGCLLWLEHGLRAPDIVRAATQEYRSESDVIGGFLDDCCELAPGLEVPSGELYAAYRQWAERGGEYVLSQTSFGRRIDERGFDVRKNGLKYRRGLSLRTAMRWTPDSSGRSRTVDSQLSVALNSSDS
jgi:putative DNA primase/helicase